MIISNSFRCYGGYKKFLNKRFLITSKLLKQWYLLMKLKSCIRTFYGLNHDLVYHYEIPRIWPVRGAGNAYPSGEFIPSVS